MGLHVTSVGVRVAAWGLHVASVGVRVAAWARKCACM